MEDYSKYGYEEIGMCNSEKYYICDECGADEFAFDENGVSQGWNRMFRDGKQDICELCLQIKLGLL
jgi:hypothetical protein